MKTWKVLLIVAVTLLVADLAADLVRRRVLPEVPRQFLGSWISLEDDCILDISSNTVSVTFSGRTRVFDAEKIQVYYHGPILGNLFGQPHLAFVCSDRSSRAELSRTNLSPPRKYRKALYFDMPNGDNPMQVRETRYDSQGWEQSEGVYEGLLGNFVRQ